MDIILSKQKVEELIKTFEAKALHHYRVSIEAESFYKSRIAADRAKTYRHVVQSLKAELLGYNFYLERDHFERSVGSSGDSSRSPEFERPVDSKPEAEEARYDPHRKIANMFRELFDELIEDNTNRNGSLCRLHEYCYRHEGDGGR